jgi:hypothetical protein
MVIRHICLRCRHESGMVQIQGGNPIVNSMFFGMDGPTLCIRCGGWVYAVQEDQELPDEFLPRPRRLLRAAIASSYKTVILWWGFALALTVPSGNPPMRNWYPSWILVLAAIAAVVGFGLPWAIGFNARGPMVNLPYPRGMTSPGEFPAMAPFFIPTILVAVGLFWFGIRKFAPPDTTRGGVARAIAGLVVAVLTVSFAGYDTFRFGRKRLKPDSPVRFGSPPE